MNRRILKLLVPLLLVWLNGLGQERCSEAVRIRVPLVDYTPCGFTSALQEAMSGDPQSGYVEYVNGKILACFRHVVYTPRLTQSPTKFVRDITAADRAMTVGPLFSRFESVVRTTTDSCFFFSLFPNRPSVFSYDLLGRYVDGRIRYMDREGHEFDGLRELIDARFGGMDRFAEAWLNFSEKALLNDCQHNGLHDFQSVDEAVNQLKRDPGFWFRFHPEETDAVIARFLDQLQSILSIDSVRETLTGEIMDVMAGEPPLSWSEVLWQYRQAEPSVYLAGWNVKPVLERNFHADDYVRLLRGLRMRQAETLSAYLFLADTFRDEILKSGSSGILDDCSILQYLARYLAE